MLNCVYRLTAPHTFTPVECAISTHGGECAIVRPTYLSICNADMRYYLGKRSPEAMAKKLPMALIHEGIGTVITDPTGTFARGQRVVMLPNAPVETDPYIGENYLRSSRFCGSGYDGFMQEYVALPPSRIVELPGTVSDEVAAFTEIISVAMHATRRFASIAHGRRETVGVWGDGNLGFLVALNLRMQYPDMHIVIVGRNRYKLNDFTFADSAYCANELGEDVLVDHAFECCGGDGSTSAIDQIIDHIKPEGTISLLGVSENPVPINTRMVLEKGLRLFGSSRSGRGDFEAVAAMYAQHPEVVGYLTALVGSVNCVQSIRQAVQAFEKDTVKPMGKTVMKWEL